MEPETKPQVSFHPLGLKRPMAALLVIAFLGLLLSWSFSVSMAAARITEGPKQAESFRVRGTIRSYTKVSAIGSKITFNSHNSSTELTTDENGSYETVLPVGTYTMHVEPPAQYHGRYLQAYNRPWFTVSSASEIVLNVVLRPVANCDAVPVEPGRTLSEDEQKNACGGSDIFTLPSEQNAPCQLLVQYSRRHVSGSGYVYAGRQVPDTSIKFPVSVAFNLFSLQASNVVYDAQDRILEASGEVTVEYGNGVTKHLSSLAVKMENGQAVPLD